MTPAQRAAKAATGAVLPSTGPTDAIALQATLSDPAEPTEALCQANTLTVLYDGACPVCRREIALYQGMPASQPLAFVDISDAATDVPKGTERARLLARFHVQSADGQLLDGARAFTALWAALPGWRWVAKLAVWPGVTPVLEWLYRVSLRVRPWVQRVFRAFEPSRLPVPVSMRGDLRSDHAGETGAVWIYLGVLAVARDDSLRAFAGHHLATERKHLHLITPLLPWPQRSRLLVFWRLAGFLTGALPALAGPRAVYATIAAVETFVDAHYQQQIDRIDARPLSGQSEWAPLRSLLAECQADERAHRDEARQCIKPAPGRLLRAWCAMVGAGSKAAVALARRL